MRYRSLPAGAAWGVFTLALFLRPEGEGWVLGTARYPRRGAGMTEVGARV